LDKTLEKKLRKLCEEHPDEVVTTLLESHFWLKSLATNTNYVRFDDDTYMGHISIAFSQDADGWLEVLSNKDPEDPYSHRFRMPMFGGGQSGRVRTALLILALAIKLDNEKRPQNRPPRNKSVTP